MVYFSTMSAQLSPENARRVMITGIGLILSNANVSGDPEPVVGIDPFWNRVKKGQSNIGLMPPQILETMYRISREDCQIGAMFGSNFNPREYLPSGVGSDVKVHRAPPDQQLIAAVIYQASQHAGLDLKSIDYSRTGVAVSTSTGPVEVYAHARDLLLEERESNPPGYVNAQRRGSNKLQTALLQLSRFGLPDSAVRMAAGILGGARGVVYNDVSACASGAGNIIEAARAIKRDEADVMVAGAGEQYSGEWGEVFRFGEFLARGFNNEPTRASRPFDKDRKGLVPGEGAAVLVLESLQHVVNTSREKKVLAEMLSGSSGIDVGGASLDDPRPIAEAMDRALRLSGLRNSGTDFLAPHAPSTIKGDKTEAVATAQINPRATIYSVKELTGHLFAAAPAVNAAVCTMVIRDQFIPPQINLDHPGTYREDGTVDVAPFDQLIFARERNGHQLVRSAQFIGIGVQGITKTGIIVQFDHDMIR